MVSLSVFKTIEKDRGTSERLAKVAVSPNQKAQQTNRTEDQTRMGSAESNFQMAAMQP